MKKTFFVLAVFFIPLLFADKAEAFREGTRFWHKHAEYHELISYYSRQEVDELCTKWVEVGLRKQYTRVRNRKAIKEVLENNGLDPLLCMKMGGNTIIINNN